MSAAVSPESVSRASVVAILIRSRSLMRGAGLAVLRCLLLATILAVGPAADALAQTALAPSKQGVEMLGKRGRHSRTFKLGGDLRRTEVSSGALNYRDAAGAWKPVDTTLVPRLGTFGTRSGDY